MSNKIGILMMSHGNYAFETLNSVQMISGKSEHIIAIGLKENESKEEFKDKFIHNLNYLINKYSKVICLIDIYGGTPFNVFMEYMYQNSEINFDFRKKVVGYTGFNLPVALELSFLDTFTGDIKKRIKKTLEESFTDLSDIIEDSSSEELNL